MRSIILLVALCACLAGCISTVRVTRVDGTNPNAAGIRYFLPQVFLVLTPKPDGTMSVETRYLPDPAHEYTVTTTSLLGNYTIEINRSEEGFLETVSFSSNNTELAKQLISSHATVRAAEIEASSAKAKLEAEQAKAASDARAAATAAAALVLAEAQTALRVATAKVDLLRAAQGRPGAPADLPSQLLAAEAAQAEAAMRIDIVRERQVGVAFNPASANAPAPGKYLKAPEPVFLRVKMLKDDVELIQAFEQTSRDTWEITPAQTGPSELEVLPAQLVIRPAAKSGALSATVRSNMPLRSTRFDKAIDHATKKQLALPLSMIPVVSLQPDKVSVRIELPKNFKAGDYVFDFKFDTGTKEKPEVESVTLTVRVEK